MSHSYSTSVSHLFFGGTAVCCGYMMQDQEINFAHGALMTAACHGSIGTVRYAAVDDEENAIAKTYNATSLIQGAAILALFTTQMYQQSGIDKNNISLAHLALPLVPVIDSVSKDAENIRNEIVDAALAINAISLGVISYLQESYYGIAAALTNLAAHFAFKKRDAEEKFLNLPVLDWYNYSMCVSMGFATAAVIQTSTSTTKG